MTGNIMGRLFTVTSFGESHGPCVGALIDGCPAGLPLSREEIQEELNLRRPGRATIYSGRGEPDEVEILSGLFEGHTTGAPLCMLVRNRGVDSRPYEEFRRVPRPGHADYTARIKYGGFGDWRGGGRFSGRITASYVMAGAVAKKLLSFTLGVEVLAYTTQIGRVKARKIPPERAKELRYSNDARCPDSEAAERMIKEIEGAMREGDSLGGIVECIVLNVPPGLGEPVFSSLESDLSRALLSIPAVKGVEFGHGFRLAGMRGSESNDPFALKGRKVVTLTNKMGGILGGISSGMPIVLRLVVKPTSSIRKRQRSVDLERMEEAEITVTGRHDPCIVPRAVPVVESMVANVLADHTLQSGLIPPVLRAREDARGREEVE